LKLIKRGYGIIEENREIMNRESYMLHIKAGCKKCDKK